MRARTYSGTSLLIVLALCANLAFPQVPQGFSYQAVVRDGTGIPLINKSVSLRVTLQDSLGTQYYTESKTITSNGQGVINHTIGGGIPSLGTFTSVPWSTGKIFIKVEIDPNGGSDYNLMGDPSKLQSVPYALFADNAKEVVSHPNDSDDEPIFVVRNKIGQIVFAVYQTGVRVYVADTTAVKGAKGGFAVGGLSSKATEETPEYFRITPDSARIYINESSVKGSKGGFAVGGMTSKGKIGSTHNLMFVASDSARIWVNSQTKGAKGGFAVGGLSSQAKGSSGNFLDLTPANSFIGQDAGKSNTTGESNAFIGYQAGFMNIDGWNNVFIGNASGRSNVSGQGNVFLGISSGYSNTSGLRNIFLGTSSGYSNTTGLQNIAVGEMAGYSLNNGSKNIFIGTVAGYSNVDGVDNVFIGNFAGNLSTGSSNVYIGRRAGQNNTTGIRNVFIGQQSGTNNLEGSGNVFIGNGAGYSETGSNKLIVSSSGNSLISGDFVTHELELNGSVKIADFIKLTPKTTSPGNPEKGDVFFDATSNSIKYFNGTDWMEIGATIALSNPFVSTLSVPVTDILATSCIVNYNISKQGSSAITQSGVLWAPWSFNDYDLADEVINSSTGIGNFSLAIPDLSPSTIYYVRSFAKNSQGISIGNMISFTTPSLSAVPTVTTYIVSDITQTTATCGGNVTLPGGSLITARGICWGTSSNPLVTGNHTTDGAVLGGFTSSLTGLTQNTIYYVRAYATNGTGTGYGNEVNFGIPGTTGTMSDIDGNSYSTQQIGSQTWMAENLKTTKYRDGTNIPNVTDGDTWAALTSGAYCWYENDASTYKETYGALYNYYAVVDSHNLCPTGWHVPTDGEWTTLTNYLGGETIAGGLLKEAGTTHWISPNTGANNGSGFTALPSGYFYNQYGFGSIGSYAEWWTSTEFDANNAWARDMGYNNIRVNRYGDFKNGGFSVRCLKD
jgi:uncharacterized protein (TIGR02145 family)